MELVHLTLPDSEPFEVEDFARARGISVQTATRVLLEYMNNESFENQYERDKNGKALRFKMHAPCLYWITNDRIGFFLNKENSSWLWSAACSFERDVLAMKHHCVHLIWCLTHGGLPRALAQWMVKCMYCRKDPVRGMSKFYEKKVHEDEIKCTKKKLKV